MRLSVACAHIAAGVWCSARCAAAARRAADTTAGERATTAAAVSRTHVGRSSFSRSRANASPASAAWEDDALRRTEGKKKRGMTRADATNERRASTTGNTATGDGDGRGVRRCLEDAERHEHADARADDDAAPALALRLDGRVVEQARGAGGRAEHRADQDGLRQRPREPEAGAAVDCVVVVVGRVDVDHEQLTATAVTTTAWEPATGRDGVSIDGLMDRWIVSFI